MNCRNLMVALTTGPLNVINRTYKSVSYLELPLSDDGRRASNTIEAALPHEGSSRSEEHTSELKSLLRISSAVFCWKKKKTQIGNHNQLNNVRVNLQQTNN